MIPSTHTETSPKTLWRSLPLVNEMWLHDVYEMPRDFAEEPLSFGPLSCPECGGHGETGATVRHENHCALRPLA
jgi:hypothetical protein